MPMALEGSQGLVTGQAQRLACCSGVGQPPPAYALLGGRPHICQLALRVQPQLSHFLSICLQT